MTIVSMEKPVYLDYVQAELDAQYDNPRHVEGYHDIVQRYGEFSNVARRTLPHRLNLSYGQSPREMVDLFFPSTGRPSAPIVVFVHGGAWQRLDKNESAFPALSICPSGAILVVAGFDPATQVSLEQMCLQIRGVVSWVYGHADDFCGDRRRISLVAHSSGAHLAAMAAVTNWRNMALPDDPVKGAVIVSGLYDLEPVRLSYRNKMLELDDMTARKLSPIHHLPHPLTRTAVICADEDTAEFRRQSKALADRWASAGITCTFTEVAQRNHYDLVLDLAYPTSALTRLTLELVHSC